MNLHPFKNEIGDDEIRIISSNIRYSRCPDDDSIKSINEGQEQPNEDICQDTSHEMPLSGISYCIAPGTEKNDAEVELGPVPDEILEEVNRSLAEEFYSEDKARWDRLIRPFCCYEHMQERVNVKPMWDEDPERNDETRQSCVLESIDEPERNDEPRQSCVPERIEPKWNVALERNDEPRQSCVSERIDEPKRNNNYIWIIILGVIVVIAAIAIALGSGLFKSDDAPEEVGELFVEATVEAPIPNKNIVALTDSIDTKEKGDTVAMTPIPAAPAKHFTTRKDTLINNIRLVVLTPQNSVPKLQLIDEFQADTTAVLAVQAADIRRDNMEIVGAYVKEGELLSKGEAKAGFCAIVNGQITLGVADASPMLEQALMNDGYFFRQYPLVVGSQLVENKPKGRSIRKALVELDGAISVVLSMHKLTYHEFSQALIDLGVRNAIALVGGDSSVQYIDEEGRKFTARDVVRYDSDYINYIVWK